MKNALLFGFLLLSTVSIKAQSSFTCTFNNTTDSCNKNCTIYCTGICTNNDCCNALNITQSIVSSNLPTGWSITMCNPNGCFDTGTPSNTFILGGSSSGTVVFQIHAGSNLGTGTANVRFENAANTNDYTEFIITGIAMGGGTTTAIIEASNSGNLVLSQNYPNPFSNYTLIDYNLNSDNGLLVITDLSGKTVKKYILNGQSGQITISDNLNAGTYFYSLWDNESVVIDSKMMQVVK